MSSILQSIKEDELLSKVWIAGTDFKAFKNLIVNAEISTISVLQICDETLDIVNTTIKTKSSSFSLFGYLLYGVVRIFQLQINALHENTIHAYNLNIRYPKQSSSLISTLLDLNSNGELLHNDNICDDSSDEDQTYQVELNKFLAEGEKNLSRNPKILNKITLPDNNNDCNLNDGINNEDMFENLTPYELQNFIDIIEGNKTYFDVRDPAQEQQYDEKQQNDNDDLHVNEDSLEQLRNEEIVDRNNQSIPQLNEISNISSEQENVLPPENHLLEIIDLTTNEENDGNNISNHDNNVNNVRNDLSEKFIKIIRGRPKRKNKLQIDKTIKISSKEIIEQMEHYENILRSFDPKNEMKNLKSSIAATTSTVLLSTPIHKNLCPQHRSLFNFNSENPTATNYDPDIIKKILNLSTNLNRTENNDVDENDNDNNSNRYNEETVENIERYILMEAKKNQQRYQQEEQLRQQHQNIFDCPLSYNLRSLSQCNSLTETENSVENNSRILNNNEVHKKYKTTKLRFEFTISNEEHIQIDQNLSSQEKNINNKIPESRKTRSKSKTLLSKEELIDKLQDLWMKSSVPITMNELCKNLDRKAAAKTFALLLELTTTNYVKLQNTSESTNAFTVERGTKLLEK